MWKIEKIVRKGDYNYAVVKDHPNASSYGYVLHHRVVVENHLGRILDPNEVVHHKNGIKLDNRIENLEVMLASDHSREHQLERGRKWADLICPSCNKLFSMPFNRTHAGKGSGISTSCSRSCRGKFYRQIQLHGVTAELQDAISGNIVRTYRKYVTDNPEETIDNMGSVETIRIPPEIGEEIVQPTTVYH